jgi:hypothetical protein
MAKRTKGIAVHKPPTVAVPPFTVAARLKAAAERLRDATTLENPPLRKSWVPPPLGLDDRIEFSERQKVAEPVKTLHVGFVDVFDWNTQTISFTIDRAILFDTRYEQSLLEMLRKCPERGERRFERIQLSTEAKP